MKTTPLTNDEIREVVRQQYEHVATGTAQGTAPGCCAGAGAAASLELGYSQADLAAVPVGANMGLGCGNPQALAALKPGETVLDLGCGGGFDCFLAAKQVGKTGLVIGVDMTPAMVAKARTNASKLGADRVSFRLGEIEHLPVADASVDAIMSNCVINLSPEKNAVFREALRVLKPGGRLAISDVVLISELPTHVTADPTALTACVSGAIPVADLKSALSAVGFVEIRVDVDEQSRTFIATWLPGSGIENHVRSARICARKPGPE